MFKIVVSDRVTKVKSSATKRLYQLSIKQAGKIQKIAFYNNALSSLRQYNFDSSNFTLLTTGGIETKISCSAHIIVLQYKHEKRKFPF